MVRNGFELPLPDVVANSRHPKRPVLVFLLPHDVSAVWLDALSQIFVRHELFLARLAVDAPRRVPGVGALHVLDSVNKVGTTRCLALAQVPGAPELVSSHGAMIFDGLPDDRGLGEELLSPLTMQGQSCPIWHFLLAVSEAMLRWINCPVIVPALLLPRVIVAMCFPIKILDHRLFIHCLVRSGQLERGDKLTLLPQNLPVQALSIQDSGDKGLEIAHKGELVTIELNVFDEQSVQVGICMLTHRGQEKNLELSNKIQVELNFFAQKDK